MVGSECADVSKPGMGASDLQLVLAKVNEALEALEESKPTRAAAVLGETRLIIETLHDSD